MSRQDFLQEKRQHVTEGIVRIQDGGYGEAKEPTVSPEAVHALMGKELTTEQRLKLSSTVIDTVLRGDAPPFEEPRRSDAPVASPTAPALAAPEPDAPDAPEPIPNGDSLALAQLLQEATVSETGGDEDAELLQQPYRESLDYLNDQFSLLECEIRIAEHRRQSTKEDVGVEEPFLLRSRKVNVFEHEAKRKLALARISHRLKLTREAGLEVPRLEALHQKTKLDDFEKNVVVMLVGNTLSPKIQATLNVGERRFLANAPLQVRVILETFCRDFKEEVQKRVYFYKSSGIIRIGAGARSGDLTCHTVHIDRRILDFVVGLDTEINEVVEGSNLYKPSATLQQLVLPEDMKSSILALVDNFEQFCKYRKSSGLDDVIAHGSGLVLMFCGPSGTGKTLMVNALAAHLDKRVLLVNFKTLYSHHSEPGLGPDEDGSNVLKLFREAEMSDAVLFFDECESLFSQRSAGGNSEMTALLTAMERYEGMIFLATNRPFDLDEAMYRRITSVFTFSKPDHIQRLEIWNLYTKTGVPLAPGIDWEKIAMKFALTGGYIKNAIVSALLLAISRNNIEPQVTEEDITGGCIMQVRGSLQMQSFAKRLVPRAGLDSLVLTPSLKQKLLDIVAFEKARPLLLENWGFGDIGSEGPGKVDGVTKPVVTTALFWGGAGTGKTAVAEALGFEFGRALKVVNFPEVTSELRMSKSNGANSLETTFEEAKAADAVLVIEGIRPENFLDDADSGLDTTFQQLAFHIERFSGVVLLLVTSDDVFRLQLLPQEFARLVKFLVVFDHPSAEQRVALWRSALPPRVPLSGEVDFEELGGRFDLNADAISSAAFRAAAAAVLRQGDQRQVMREDLVSAAELELSLLDKSKSVVSSRPSIEEFLRKHRYSDASSFHRVYLLKEERGGCERLCLQVQASELGRLFIPILTLDGVEGSYPEMFDQHPKNMGLCFSIAPSGRDVLLIEAQDRLSQEDLEGSMYWNASGGGCSMRPGHIAKLEPVAQNGMEEFLLDLTDWLKRFSEYFKGDEAHTQILEMKGYSSNFLVRCSTQQPSNVPVKSAKGSLTVYYTVAFSALPEVPMVPRPSDPRVGYFTNAILVGGPRQATTVQHVISRWDLTRHQQLKYVIDRAVPKLYHETIKTGVHAWNAAFEFVLGRAVLHCVAPDDSDYPEEYQPGDGRHISIFMTNPSTKGLLGYGPSAFDYRSGEILMASVVLGLKSHVKIPSDFSESLFKSPDSTCCQQQLLDADDPDVMKYLLETVVHEVGHTLGLRHNFIAAEDGHSSVMDYPDDLDTSDPSKPVFGGHFLGGPGRYDKYAISYGYTPLDTEVRGQRHSKLELLANGQSVEEELSAEPRNPLFASDDDVGGLDPRVQQRLASVERMGVDKILWALQRRKTLLEHVQSSHVDCNLYSQRVLNTLEICARAVLAAGAYIGGALVDARRSGVQRVEADAALRYVAVVLNMLVGPVFRLDGPESDRLLVRREGEYGVVRTSVLELHGQACESILGRLLDPSVLARHEGQRETAVEPRPHSTLELLSALAFGMPSGFDMGPAKELDKVPDGLLWPLRHDFRLEEGQSAAELRAATEDPLACQARLAFAKLVNHLARDPAVHALVRSHAMAFVLIVQECLQGLKDRSDLGTLVQAHWGLLLEALKEKRRQGESSDDAELVVLMGKMCFLVPMQKAFGAMGKEGHGSSKAKTLHSGKLFGPGMKRFFARAHAESFSDDLKTGTISIAKSIVNSVEPLLLTFCASGKFFVPEAGLMGDPEKRATLSEAEEKDPDAALKEMVMVIGDTYMSKRDLWQLQLAMMQHRGRLIYRGFRRNFCEHERLVSFKDGKPVACGMVGVKTDVAFRSSSTHMFLLIEVSSELFSFGLFGRYYWEVLLECFGQCLERACAVPSGKRSTSHFLRIVLFARAKDVGKAACNTIRILMAKEEDDLP
ncbi:cdc48, partial [Symbiodinium pilosum]